MDVLLLYKKTQHKFTNKIIDNKLFHIPTDVTDMIFQYLHIIDMIRYLLCCKFLYEKYYNQDYFSRLAKNRLGIKEDKLIKQLADNKMILDELCGRVIKKDYNIIVSLDFLKKYTKNIYTYVYSLIAFPEHYLGINRYMKTNIKISFNMKYCRGPFFHDLSYIVAYHKPHIHHRFEVRITNNVSIKQYRCKCQEKIRKSVKLLFDNIKKINSIKELKDILIKYNPKYEKEVNNLLIRDKDVVRLRFFDIYVYANNVFLINSPEKILSTNKPGKYIKFYQYYQGLSEFNNESWFRHDLTEDFDPSDNYDSGSGSCSSDDISSGSSGSSSSSSSSNY